MKKQLFKTLCAFALLVSCGAQAMLRRAATFACKVTHTVRLHKLSKHHSTTPKQIPCSKEDLYITPTKKDWYPAKAYYYEEEIESTQKKGGFLNEEEEEREICFYSPPQNLCVRALRASYTLTDNPYWDPDKIPAEAYYVEDDERIDAIFIEQQIWDNESPNPFHIEPQMHAAVEEQLTP